MIERFRNIWTGSTALGMFRSGAFLVQYDQPGHRYSLGWHLQNFADWEQLCGYCGGTGSVDSGGFTPWGAPIELGCPECAGEPAVRAADEAGWNAAADKAASDAELLVEMAEWFAQHADCLKDSLLRDFACDRCFPNSNCLVRDFACIPHRAIDMLAEIHTGDCHE